MRFFYPYGSSYFFCSSPKTTLKLVLSFTLSSIWIFFLLSTAGITLAQFGGVQKHSMDQNKVPVRGDIHIIIVGIPISSCVLRMSFFPR